MTEDNGPIRIAVGGGKGGVGKSVVAANLSVALAQLGFRTTLVDVDFGQANQHTLFGIDRPGTTLQSFLDREVSSLEEVTSPTGVPRLFLVPGMGAIPGAANLAHSKKLKLLRHIKRLDADVVVIDVGAGVSFNTLDFFEAGDLRIVVTTPQLTAMQNAYCFMKAAVHRTVRKSLDNHAQREAYAAAHARGETDKISDLRRRCLEEGVGIDEAIERITSGFATRIVGNMLEGPAQKKVLSALSRMGHDFLDVSLPVGPHLAISRPIHQSVTRRRPFVLSHPGHEASVAMLSLAEALVTEDVSAIRRGRRLPEAKDWSEEALADPRRLGEGVVDYLRSENRVPVDYPAQVTIHGRAVSARVRDLSPRGALLEGLLEADLGDELELKLEGFRGAPVVRGVVRHVAPSRRSFGVELDVSAHQPVSRLLQQTRAPLPKPQAPARAAVG